MCYPRGRTKIDSTGILVSIQWREGADWITVSADRYGYDIVRKYLEAKVIRWGLVHKTLKAYGFESITIEEFEARRSNGPSKEFMDSLREELRRKLGQ